MQGICLSCILQLKNGMREQAPAHRVVLPKADKLAEGGIQLPAVTSP
jgi:hypothetical protein